jgi:hypothetical protein
MQEAQFGLPLGVKSYQTRDSILICCLFGDKNFKERNSTAPAQFSKHGHLDQTLMYLYTNLIVKFKNDQVVKIIEFRWGRIFMSVNERKSF